MRRYYRHHYPYEDSPEIRLAKRAEYRHYLQQQSQNSSSPTPNFGDDNGDDDDGGLLGILISLFF